jgi:hypothetical protein
LDIYDQRRYMEIALTCFEIVKADLLTGSAFICVFATETLWSHAGASIALNNC